MKNTWKILLAIVLMSFFFTACNSSNPLDKNELFVLNKAVEEKLQTASQIFKSNNMNAVVEYCKKSEKITTDSGIFIIDCSITADFYRPEDKIQVSDDTMTLPVSLYARAENVLYLLDEGWKFRDPTISVFARNEKDYHNTILKKHKDM